VVKSPVFRSEQSVSRDWGHTLKTSIFLTAILSAALLTSCAPAFKGTASQSKAGGDNSSNGSNPDSGSNDDAWNKISVEGAVQGGEHDQEKAVSIDKERKELVLLIPMPPNPLVDSNLNVPIPEIPGARLGFETQPDGSKALALRIPLERLLRGIEFLPPSRLPNGDPLPAIPDGELPSIAVKISRWADVKATIYLAPSVVGVFVNTPFDPKFSFTFPIKNKAKTRTWGYLSTVPKKDAFDGGIFLSFVMPEDLARFIDDHL